MSPSRGSRFNPFAVDIMESWPAYIDAIRRALGSLSVRDDQRQELDPGEGFSRWLEWTLALKEGHGRHIYFVGNGASAAMASHCAADVAKNCRVPTQVFTDPALVTALANDIAYPEVFAEPLRWFLGGQDMVVAISSSGNSLNVIRAVEAARQIGARVITLSAMGANNAVRNLGGLNFYVPADTYGFAESAHGAILHYWMDLCNHKMNESSRAF